MRITSTGSQVLCFIKRDLKKEREKKKRAVRGRAGALVVVVGERGG